MEAGIEFIPSGGVTSPRGFLAGAVCAGIKNKDEDCLDLGILFSEATCTAAAVFTTLYHGGRKTCQEMRLWRSGGRDFADAVADLLK